MSLPPEEFDAAYAASADPWGIERGWYEQRKRAVVLAALPDARVGSAYEPGCATGALSVLLAPRCDELLCTDSAGRAVDRARDRLRAHTHVRVERAMVPAQWPAGPFDLVVLSELAYYLDVDDRAQLRARLRESLRPGGTLLAVHWTRAAPGYPAGGREVQEELVDEPGLRSLVVHDEADFRLDVLARVPPPARSVAQRTGLR